jgi:hypothetical protein
MTPNAGGIVANGQSLVLSEGLELQLGGPFLRVHVDVLGHGRDCGTHTSVRRGALSRLHEGHHRSGVLAKTFRKTAGNS